MDQCLHIPEIVRAICDETTKKTALSVALASRNFLQPGLDRIWREVDCFEAMIACLPTDLWEVEEAGGGLNLKLHFLRRPITSGDIERYKTHYAPRIRQFGLKMVEGAALFGLDAFQGIQLATQWQPGALSPLLKQLVWPYSVINTDPGLRSEDYFQETFPFVSLFLADTVTALEVTLRSASHLQVASVHSATERLPNLRILSLTTVEPGVSLDGVGFSPWNMVGLVDLNMSAISAVAVPLLASLPHLENLEIANLMPHSTGPTTYQQSSASYFSQLKVLKIARSDKHDIMSLLSLVPPQSNRLQLVKIRFTTSERSSQNVIDTLAHLANVETFCALGLDITTSTQPDETEVSLDMDAGEALDISPLMAFRRMIVLHISTTQAIQLSPEEAMRISREWRTLAIFDLNGTRPCRSTPLVDHDHILAILKGCRVLQHLGLQFDASRVPANSQVDTQAPFPLGTFCVGDSPIYSPPRVLAFLKANFSQLLALEIYACEDGQPSIFERRWSAVQQGWSVHTNTQA